MQIITSGKNEILKNKKIKSHLIIFLKKALVNKNFSS